VKADFYILSPIRWDTIVIERMESIYSLNGLEQRICADLADYIEKANLQGQPLLRVVLRGPSPLYRELKDSQNVEVLTDGVRDLLGLGYLEVDSERVIRPIDPGAYRGGPHTLGMAYSLLDRLYTDDELLMRLKPQQMAGCSENAAREEVLGYLKSLLEGAEYEVADRFLRGEEK
jgi:hypothetical protein